MFHSFCRSSDGQTFKSSFGDGYKDVRSSQAEGFEFELTPVKLDLINRHAIAAICTRAVVNGVEHKQGIVSTLTLTYCLTEFCPLFRNVGHFDSKSHPI